MKESLWQAVSSELKGETDLVRGQSRETGSFTDVGNWQSGLADFHLRNFQIGTSEQSSTEVLKMVTSASKSGRGQLVLQLSRMGKLDELCENLPWAKVKKLHDSISDPAAKKLLRRYFEGKGGGKSVSTMLENQIINDIKGGRYKGAAGLTLLKTAYSSLTGGFADSHDEAYDAKESGNITGGEYMSATTKALGRAAVVTGATLASGGVAGRMGRRARDRPERRQNDGRYDWRSDRWRCLRNCGAIRGATSMT